MLPEWMALETRPDVVEGDVTTYEGVSATTIGRALRDMSSRMPRERWLALLDEVVRRELIDERELDTAKEGLG